MPSSMTRFVEANMNATAATKCAPLRTRERAAARAANEHEDEAAPKAVARETLWKSGAPIWRVSLSFGTKAWIMPLTK